MGNEDYLYRYKDYLGVELGMACSEADRQEILRRVATLPHKRGDPPMAWRRKLALAYGWRPTEAPATA